MTIIETTNFLLRRPSEDDALILRDLWRNDLVRIFLGGVLSDENINKKILALQCHWDQHGFGLWAVLNRDNKEILGLCGPHYSEDENIEISYMFFPQFWGKGFAQESVIAIIDYSFKVLNIGAVIAITQEANLRSCLLLESIGMKHFKNFEKFDAIQCTYRLSQNEWQQNLLTHSI